MSGDLLSLLCGTNLADFVRSLAAAVVALPEALLTTPLVNAGTTYHVCVEPAGGSVTCSPVAIPVGAPYQADVNGDLVPDISVQLTPRVDLFSLGDATVDFSVVRLANVVPPLDVPALPSAPSLPNPVPPVPGLPGLPGLPGPPAAPVPPSPPGLLGLPGLPGLPPVPGVPGLPGLPAPPGLPGLPSLPSPPGLPSLPGLPNVPVPHAPTTIPGAATGPLPLHVFAIYDPALTGKRVQFGYDGRASTVADRTDGRFTLKNANAPITADIDVRTTVARENPGGVEAVTVGAKALRSTGLGQAPAEVDPLVGSVRFAPVPDTSTANLHLQQAGNQDQALLQLTNSGPTRVDAAVRREVTSSTPTRRRDLGVAIDRSPTQANVGLLQRGNVTALDYKANAGGGRVSVFDSLVPDTAQAGSFTRSVYDLEGSPREAKVELTGGSDVAYQASDASPQVAFSKLAQVEGDPQATMIGLAQGVPGRFRLTQANATDSTTLTYDGAAPLGRLQTNLLDRPNDLSEVTLRADALPTHLVLNQLRSTGVLDYSSDGTIGMIDAKIARGGAGTSSLPGQHITVVQRGSGLGIELNLAGVRAARVDPSQSVTYEFDLPAPLGGLPFAATIDLADLGVVAALSTSRLPTGLHLTLNPTDRFATWQATEELADMKAVILERSENQLMDLEAEDVPATMGLTWTTGPSPGFTYTASSRLGRLRAIYRAPEDQTTVDVLGEDVPPYLTARAGNPVVVDARSGPTNEVGSSYIGRVWFQAAFGTDLITDARPGDNVLVRATDTAGAAEVDRHGLRWSSTSVSAQEVHQGLLSQDPRPIRLDVDVPPAVVTGVVGTVPSRLDVDVTDRKVHTDASSPISTLSLAVDRRTGTTVAVDLTGVPTTTDLTFDEATKAVSWSASGGMTSMGALARLAPAAGSTRRTDISLSATDVPPRWDATFTAAHPKVQAPGGAFGTLSLFMTNHGTAATIPDRDHFSLVSRSDAGDVSDLDSDLDASVRTRSVSLIELESRPEGFLVNLGSNSPNPFDLNVDVERRSRALSVKGTISALAPQTHFEVLNGVVKYTGQGHPDLSLVAASGNRDALNKAPTPRTDVHGLSLRDASGCVEADCGAGVRMSLFLTGAPDEFTFTPGTRTLAVRSFAPRLPLALDADLTTVTSERLTIEATQNGIPSPVDFTFGPVTPATLPDGTETTHLEYTASQPLGALAARIVVGTDDEGAFELSSVPTSVAVDTRFGDKTKTIKVAMSAGVDALTALYRHAGNPEYEGAGVLTDVPAEVELTLDKKDNGQGVEVPVLSYTANAAGLDGTAFALGSLFEEALSATAQVSLSFVNLGQTVSASLDGSTLQIASSPATEALTLLGSGRIVVTESLDFDESPFHNRGSVTFTLDISELLVAVEQLQSLTVSLGPVSTIAGQFGSFEFGERGNLRVDLTDQLDVDLGVGSFTLVSAEVHKNLGNPIGNFRIASDQLGEWATVPVPPVWPCFEEGLFGLPNPGLINAVVLLLRPHPQQTTAGSYFKLPAPPSGLWVVTPNPFGQVPNFILDIIARIARGSAGGQRLTTRCATAL